MPSTEAPRRSSRRGGSTGGRRKQDSLPSGITPATARHAHRETSSSSLLTKSSFSVQMPIETEVPKAQIGAPIQLEVKQDLQVVTDVSKQASIREENLLDFRRKDSSGRSGRKFNTSQASGNRKTNDSNNTVPKLISSASTQQPSGQPSHYVYNLSNVSNTIPRTSTSSDKLPTDIPMTGVGPTRVIITADSPPQGENRRSASRSEGHKNLAEVNESRSTGQFQNKSRLSTGSERSFGLTQQRTHLRNSVKSGVSADAMPTNNPRATSWDFSHQISSRSRDASEDLLKSRGGSRRSHLRGQDFDLHKVTNVFVTALFKCGFFNTETNFSVKVESQLS